MTENILFYQKKPVNHKFLGEKAYSDKKQPIVKRTNSVKQLLFKGNLVNTTLEDGVYGPIKGKGTTSIAIKNKFEVRNGIIIDELNTEGRYVWTQKFLDEEIDKGTEIFLSNRFGFNVLRSDQGEKIKAPSDIIDSKVEVGTNEDASEEIANLFNTDVGEIFDYSKPTTLLKYLLQMVSYREEYKDCIILDFFSGSATTAEAVMQLNAEDGGNRKFIMVQLPEQTDEKSEAYKAGYKNICEIGKERIRRAGEKILEENKDNENIDKLDVGFRVLKTDSSNMKDVYYSPEDTEQSFLDNLEDNIKEDRTQEDLLFQVMLDLGVPLSSNIEVEQIEDAKVFKVEDRFLVACFDGAISDEVVRQIADMKPFYAVFRDMSMKNDSVAVNFEQIFESVSPETIRKVL
nr:DNA methyltransferase [uncultured Finegoldia sp.]